MKLEVKDASIGYKKQVLSSNINMASEPGMVTAILGQNGCGKTTFVKSLMKLIPWCGGGAFLDGVDMRNIKDRQLWRKMAYVPQKSTSVPYSVLDMVLIGRNPYKSLFAQPDSNDRKMAEAALERKWVAHDYTPAMLTSPMTPGSVVKAASMLVGYNNNAIKIGEYMMDECVKIASTPKKCSWRNLGYINDIDALALSSNVYQFKTAMRVAGANYTYNMPFKIYNDAFSKYRNMYHSFGLGVKTGIDLPLESTGYTSKDETPGLLLDFVMGQFETYTPVQLSQYVSTIANGGNRLKPHLLKEVRSSSATNEIGKLQKTITPERLNCIDTKEEYFNRVKEGLHAVTMSSYGLGKNYIDKSHDPSGKTGTSQSFLDTDNDGIIDTETISTAFIGYAPTTNPKMSIVVTSPDSSHPNSQTDYNSLVNLHITKKISAKYFELYP